MSKIKPYKEEEPKLQEAAESMVTYTGSERNSDFVIGERDDIRCAISGEELLDKLRPRIKALFK